METFGYLVGLTAIVIGLALTETASGFYRILQHGLLKSDPLIVGRAILVILMLIGVWFDIWSVRTFPSLYSYPFFLLVFVQLLLLYLMAASRVPPNVTRRSYEPSRDIFWRLFTANQVAYSALWVVFQTERGFDGRMLLFRSYEVLLPLLIGVVLSFGRSRLLHAIGLSFLIAFQLYSYWGSRIG